MSTLYRKYRPQNFSEVVGQNHIKITLEQEIKTGKIAQAYLFCGPRAVGKTTLARVFAKSINCQTRKKTSAEPCNKCLSCREITEGRALDIIEMDAASHTQVDNVRENIIANVRVAPARAKYKVFIIDEVHMLSASSFNALLKTIEEPPAQVAFILCTTEAHKVPTTIISRCQRFDFKRISVNEVVKKLAYIAQAENIKIEKNILEAIARQADGHMRDAESLLGQIIAIASPEPGRGGGAAVTRAEADLVIPRSALHEVINLLALLIKKDAVGGIRLLNQLLDDGVDLKVFTKDVIEILRKLMLIKINPALAEKLALELGEAVELKINQLAQDLNLEQILAWLDKFIGVSSELSANFIQQLPLEIVIAEICSGSPAAKNLPSSNTGFGSGPKLAGFRNLAALKPAAASGPKLDLSVKISSGEIMEKWHEVLAKVKQYNHSLSFILRVCQPQKIQGNQLCLAFKYKFHKDRVSEAAIRNIVEKVLHQVYGLPMMIEAVIDENLEVAASKLVSDEPMDLKKPRPNDAVGQEPAVEPTPGEQGKMIDNLLKTFGGKVVS